MSGQQRPNTDDVVIHQHAPDSYTISARTGAAQISCRTFEEAIQRARSFATHAQVSIWVTTDGREFKALADL